MNRRLTTVNLQEFLRRIQAGESNRRIAQAMRMHRKTVRSFRMWAEKHGLDKSPIPDLPELDELARNTLESIPLSPQNQFVLTPYREEIETMLQRGWRTALIHRELRKRYPDLHFHPSSTYRFVRSLRPPAEPEAVGRKETAPGEEAQVDFGEAGYLIDPRTGKKRKAWFFAMVLSWSREMFVRFTFDQKLATWLKCHRLAFEWFDGVPRRMVIDNLKTAIIRAYTRNEDAIVQRGYQECANHYGFLIDPCLPAHPQHKGKVERAGVQYVQTSFLPLLEEGTTITDANRRVQVWLREEAGKRVHGTTREVPAERFEKVERAALLTLPPTAYDPAAWRKVKIHRDCYVQFEQSYYSAPYRMVGQTVWLRAGTGEIRLFSEEHRLIATHDRAARPGQRKTNPDHLPPRVVAGMGANDLLSLQRAEAIGPAAARVVKELQTETPLCRTRTVLRVLNLAKKYSPERLEAACLRAERFGDTKLAVLERILQQDLDKVSEQSVRPDPEVALRFLRPAEEWAQVVAGGASWN